MKTKTLLVILAAIASVCAAPAATVVYDFDNSAPAFTVSHSGNVWQVLNVSGNKVYQVSSNVTSNSVSSGFSVPNAAVSNFTVSVDFTVTASVNTTIGLVALASAPAGFVSGNTNTVSGYRFYYATGSGKLGVQEYVPGTGTSTTGFPTAIDDTTNFALNTAYKLTLSGVYNNDRSQLAFTWRLSDLLGANLGTYTYTDTSGILGGANFALQIYNNNSGTGTVQFDNLTVTTVPEPGTLALLGLGALALTVSVLRRGRR